MAAQALPRQTQRARRHGLLGPPRPVRPAGARAAAPPPAALSLPAGRATPELLEPLAPLGLPQGPTSWGPSPRLRHRPPTTRPAPCSPAALHGSRTESCTTQLHTAFPLFAERTLATTTGQTTHALRALPAADDGQDLFPHPGRSGSLAGRPSGPRPQLTAPLPAGGRHDKAAWQALVKPLAPSEIGRDWAQETAAARIHRSLGAHSALTRVLGKLGHWGADPDCLTSLVLAIRARCRRTTPPSMCLCHPHPNGLRQSRRREGAPAHASVDSVSCSSFQTAPRPRATGGSGQERAPSAYRPWSTLSAPIHSRCSCSTVHSL